MAGTDLISRQDTLEIINKMKEVYFDRKVVLGKVYDQIKDMPSAERTDVSEILQYLDEKLHPIVSPDHWNVYSELHDMISTLSAERVGHWIFNPIDAIELMFAKPKCSECGFESADGGNYCSNCGARMVSEDDRR